MLSFKSFLTTNYTSTHFLEQGANIALKPLQIELGSSKKVEILKHEDGKFACHIQTTPIHSLITRISLVVAALLGALIGIPLKALSLFLYHDKKEIQFLNNVFGKAPTIYQAGKATIIEPCDIYTNDFDLAQEALEAYKALQKLMVLQKKQIADPFFTEVRSLEFLNETQAGNHDLNTTLLRHIDWFSHLEQLDTRTHFTRDLDPNDEQQNDYQTKAHNFQKIHKKEIEKLRKLNPELIFTLADSNTVRLPARKAFSENSLPTYIGHCQTKFPRAL